MKPWQLISLFHPREVNAAFAALRTHGASLYAVDGASPLATFTHHRRGERGDCRDHLELPLQHLFDESSVYLSLPSEVRHVCAGLHDAARAYTAACTRQSCVLPAARDGVMVNLGKKSVLRVLRYPSGSGCRPHVDPGLCTALLGGSAGGLEVNTTDVLPVSHTNQPGDYTNYKCHSAEKITQDSATSSLCAASSLAHAAAESENALDLLPHWERVIPAHAGEAVVMASNMMGVITNGAMPGVLHRVRRDWGVTTFNTTSSLSPHSDEHAVNENCSVLNENNKSSGPLLSTVAPAKSPAGNALDTETEYRYNIIVELRPARAKRWYAATKGDA